MLIDRGRTLILILKYLEDTKAYACLLFVDFSSAFNTLQPYLLIQKVKQMSVTPFIIKCYLFFHTDHI